MADDDDDPYLAELLDLVNEHDAKPNGGSSASAAAVASSSTSSSQSASKAKRPASSILTSPGSYQASDTHRETLKLLSQLSPAGVNLPTAEDVQKAFRTLYPPFQAPPSIVALDDDDDDDMEEVNPPSTVATAGGGGGKGRAPPAHLEAVQEELEEHLDAMDLFALRDVIRTQVDVWHAGKRTALAAVAAKERERKERKEEKEKEAAKQKQKQQEEEQQQQQQQQNKKRKKEVVEVEDDVDEEDENKEQTNGFSQSQLSQSQLSQEGGDNDTNNNKKRKRGTGVGGRATLPLMLPKSVGSSSISRSFLVELDERDKAQDLTGDSGAVGRVHVEKKKGIILDLKGHQYLAHLRRCPTLLLVSVGEEEAKVEDVVENLCVLTHQHDQLEAMGGKVVSRAGGGEGGEGIEWIGLIITG